MATTTIDIDIESDLIPEGYEAVRVGEPNKCEWYIGSSGRAVECSMAGWRGDPRVIVRPLPKRPYNADEMRDLVGSVLIHANGSRHIVNGCNADGTDVYLMSSNYSGESLQQYFTHLDGRKCEVVE